MVVGFSLGKLSGTDVVLANQNESTMSDRQHPLSIDWYLFFCSLARISRHSGRPFAVRLAYTDPRMLNGAIVGGVVLNLVYLPVCC